MPQGSSEEGLWNNYDKLTFRFFSDQEARYWGADLSDSQLEGADGNVRTAGLQDKIEFLRASVRGTRVRRLPQREAVPSVGVGGFMGHAGSPGVMCRAHAASG